MSRTAARFAAVVLAVGVSSPMSAFAGDLPSRGGAAEVSQSATDAAGDARKVRESSVLVGRADIIRVEVHGSVPGGPHVGSTGRAYRSLKSVTVSTAQGQGPRRRTMELLVVGVDSFGRQKAVRVGNGRDLKPSRTFTCISDSPKVVGKRKLRLLMPERCLRGQVTQVHSVQIVARVVGSRGRTLAQDQATWSA